MSSTVNVRRTSTSKINISLSSSSNEMYWKTYLDRVVLSVPKLANRLFLSSVNFAYVGTLSTPLVLSVPKLVCIIFFYLGQFG